MSRSLSRLRRAGLERRKRWPGDGESHRDTGGGHPDRIADEEPSDIARRGAVPLLSQVADLVLAGHIPGGTTRNLSDTEGDVSWSDSVDSTTRLLLADAQTSGGLLIAIAADRAADLVSRLEAAGTPAVARIGTVGEGPAGHTTLEP